MSDELPPLEWSEDPPLIVARGNHVKGYSGVVRQWVCRHTHATTTDARACARTRLDWEMGRLEAALRSAGFEPPENVCRSCGHPGSDHDLANRCLTRGTGTFTAMTDEEKWAWAIDRLRATR